MGHIFDAVLQVVVDPGELTDFVDLVVTSPLIIVCDSRMDLVGQWNGPRASQRRRKWSGGWLGTPPSCAYVVKKSTYDIRPPEPRPGGGSEGGI